MRRTSVITAFALILSIQIYSTPANAVDLEHQTPFYAKPRPVASLQVANRSVEMLAVTQRARADTPLRRAYLDECQNMSKVMPGYPQPAFVSVDIRVKF